MSGKKLVIVMIPMLIALSACTAEPKTQIPSGGQTNSVINPYGKYDKTVSIVVGKSVDPTEKLPGADTPEANQYTRYVKDKLNIETKTLWSAAFGPDYDQKVDLSIASNNLPDAMVVNATQLLMMENSDELANLTDVYDKWASPAVKTMMDSSNGIAKKAVTYNGKMYAIPSLTVPDNGYHMTWIRKDWLDKLGLPIPKTLDDLKKDAKAFITKDPDGDGKADTIGIAGPQNGGLLYADFMESSNNMYGFDPVFASFNSYPGFWIKGSDGKAVYGSILPQTKTALAELSSMYSSGLIDKQMGIRKDSSEPIIDGKCGIFFGVWWAGYSPLPDAIKNDPKADWQCYAVPLDASGTFNVHMSTVADSFCVVKKGYANPEAAMEIINLNNRDESTFDISKGEADDEVLRLPMGPYDEVKATRDALKEVLAGTKKSTDFDTTALKPYKLLVSDAQNITKVKKAPFDKWDIQYWNPTADLSAWMRLYSVMVGTNPIYDTSVKMNKVPSLVYSQTETMQTKWANLKTMEDETFLKIIMGSAPISSFDKFVTDWKAQGGDTITAEVEKASKQ